ncbi:MAG: hypothetical protein ACXVX9_12200 [Mycobacteriaceae bacterium]
MPADFDRNDEIGAPPPCAFHHEVVRNLGDEDSQRVAAELSRQCCARRKP